jgi:hypothetical protein
MTMSCLRKALAALCVALGLGTAGARAQSLKVAPTRPVLTSLTVTLNDGRIYSLTPEQLADPKGGAIFWGDWAVSNLLIPHHRFRGHGRGNGPAKARPTADDDAEDVMNLWTCSGNSGQPPAFLVNTSDGPINPLDPGGPRFLLPRQGRRARVADITVGYADGRFHSLSEDVLRDEKSGVLVWNDYAVANIFIPFYFLTPNLPTKPEDVLRTWTTPTTPPSDASSSSTTTFSLTATQTQSLEMPAYLVKPRCIPQYL